MILKHTTLLLFMVAMLATAHAQHRKTDPQTHKKGFVDHKGKVLVPLQYDELPREWDSIMVAKKGPYLGLLGGKGEIILPFEYQELRLHLLRGGFSLVKKKATPWGIANSRGELVLPMRFESVAVIGPNLLAARAAGEKMVQVYDGKGTPLYQLPGKTVEPGFDDNSLKILGHDNKSRYTDLKGQPIFPETMPNARWTDGDVIISGSYNDYGLLNFRGDTILALNHRAVQPALPGQFTVSTIDNNHGVVDKQGQTIVPFDKWQIFTYEKFYRVEDYSHKSGLFASDGQVILPKDYQIREPGVYPPYENEPDAQPKRFLLVGSEQKPYLKGFYSATDASVILPIEYKEIWYRSIKQPVIASKESPSTAKREVMAFDLTGKPLLAAPFPFISHTKNPRILLVSRGDNGLFGFLNLDGDTSKTAFTLRYVTELRPGIYSALQDSLAVMMTPEGKRLYAGSPDGLIRANDAQKSLFEKLPGASGELLLVTPKPGSGLIGINDEGKEFILEESASVPKTAPVAPAVPSVRDIKTDPSASETPTEMPNLPVKKEVEASKQQGVEEVAEIITIEAPSIEEKIWEAEQVDTPPQFPGGLDSAAVFFQKRLKPCEIMLQTNDERYWHTKLEIVVESNGMFTKIQSLSSFGNACNRDVEEVAKRMPRWMPAMKDGKAVRCRYFLTVKHREK
ncbi:MAG: hypothetical protein GC192_02575 [Bacteroidetes bacterium]|nr:hypothetical protein [Bacteroidota bacterium]